MRVPAACGLTLSAGSEISLHQVNCQTAQSLKLNIKAIARRHRAIPTPPQQRQFWLSKQREDGFPGQGSTGIGMEQPVTVPGGAMGQTPARPGAPLLPGWANPSPQTVPFLEISFLWYQKG